MPEDPSSNGNTYSTKHVHFRPSELGRPLAERERGSLSTHMVAKRDLQRYYWLIAESEPDLSEAQWNFLHDILNGTVLDTQMAAYLWAEAADAEDSYYEKWSVDKDDLVRVLRGLSSAEQLAVVDRVERFWANAPYDVDDLESDTDTLDRLLSDDEDDSDDGE